MHEHHYLPIEIDLNVRRTVNMTRLRPLRPHQRRNGQRRSHASSLEPRIPLEPHDRLPGRSVEGPTDEARREVGQPREVLLHCAHSGTTVTNREAAGKIGAGIASRLSPEPNRKVTGSRGTTPGRQLLASL